jgi:hypothetical protein
VSDSGEIIDHEGRTVGKLAESEDAPSLVGNTVTATGDVVNEAGDILGRASLDDKEREFTTGDQKTAAEAPEPQESGKHGGASGFLSSASSVLKQGLAFGRSKKISQSSSGQEPTSEAPESDKAGTAAQAGQSKVAQPEVAQSDAAKSEAASKSQSKLQELPPQPAGELRTDVGESLRSGQSEALDAPSQGAGALSDGGESQRDAASEAPGAPSVKISTPSEAPEDLPTAGEHSRRDAASEAPGAPSEFHDTVSEIPDELRTEAGESRKEGSQAELVQLEDREVIEDQKSADAKAGASPSQIQGSDMQLSQAGEGEEQVQGEQQEGGTQDEEGAEKLDFTILKDAKVNKAGNLVDDKGDMVGRVIEGNVKQLLGKKSDDEGNIWNDSGKIVGKAEPISQAERDGQKDFAPFEDFPDAVVEADGRVTSKGEQIGIVIEGDPKSLKGSKVDEDGDILDRNGNSVGKAEPKEKEEPEKIDYGSLKDAKVNKVGNLVNSKGDVVGKVVEGSVKLLHGKTSDENGDIWDSAGKIVGKAEPLTSGGRDEQKDFAPFENFPNAIVEADGRVTSDGQQVGTVVQGDPKRLKGSKVDEDGDILDRNGNVIGKAEPWDEPEPEAEEIVDRSILAGKRVNKRGNIVDSAGTIYGRVIEGNLLAIVGRMCDKEGNIRSESGDIIGKAEIVSESEREGSKEGPFAELSGLTVTKDGKVVTPSGDVIGRLISGDPKVVYGRSVDEDGDVIDRNGNILGKAERWEEPEIEMKKDPLAGRRVNREGNVVDDDGNIIGKLVSGDLLICSGKEIDDDGDVINSKGNAIGHVSLIEDISLEVETEEERKAREEEAKEKAEAERDRKLAGQLGACIEQSLDKIRPICKLITDKIDSAERTPKEELDEEALVREVKPLIEEGGKILSETSGIIRGLDPGGRIQRQAKQRSGTREASPEEHHLAEQLKEVCLNLRMASLMRNTDELTPTEPAHRYHNPNN